MRKLRKILQYKNLFLIFATLSLIIGLIITLIPNYKSKYNINETNFKCKLKNYNIDGNKLDLDLYCKENVVGVYYIKTEEEKIDLENSLEMGSTLNLVGDLTSPTNNTIPYLFNYKKYLYNKKTYYILNVSKIINQNSTKNILYKLKNMVLKRVKNIKNNEYIYAYILGNTDKIDVNVLKSFRTNGISHLFALSGLHVSIFSLILMKILNKMKIKEKGMFIIIFTLLLLFSFITGFSPSILRASLLFFLLGINKVYNLEIKTIDVLYLVFTILVLINPFIIYNMSFLLSFVTTYFIILSKDLLNGKNYITTLLKVSFISFIASVGLSIYYFNSINPLGIIENLVFVPLVTFLIFPLSIIVFIFSFINPVLTILTNIMETISIFFSKFTLTVYFPQIHILSIIIYYMLLFIIIKYKKKFLVIILIILIIFWKIKYLFNFNTTVYFLDVGQGDCALIVSPHNKKTIMIDTGGKIAYNEEKWKKKSKNYSISKDTLIPFMRKIGIYKLDYLILSHGDQDHAGEALNLINNFNIKTVYINKGNENTLEQKIPNRKKLDIPYLQIENIKMYSLNEEIFDSENDNSLVLLIKINNTKIIFMGDASIKTEKSILKTYNIPNIEILKVGHHGSKTSSSGEFLSIINPKINIISSGKNNRYNHPNKEVVNLLEKYGKIYNTSESGTIKITIGNEYKITNFAS